MVKIYTRIIKKCYLNQKRVYKHKYVAIPIPKKFHQLLQPFLGEDLKISVAAHPNRLIILLTSNQSPEKPD